MFLCKRNKRGNFDSKFNKNDKKKKQILILLKYLEFTHEIAGIEIY